MDLREEAQCALRLVTESLRFFENKYISPDVYEKESSRDLVTSYDYEIESFIMNELKARPIPILSEESSSGVDLVSGKMYWIVDPIDGTVNYCHHLHYYGIAIGLCTIERESIVPHVGAFAMPATKEIFFTDETKSSYLNGKRISVEDATLDKSLIVACFSSKEKDADRRERQYQLFADLNDHSRGVLRIGSASTAICYTAASRFQVTYGLDIPLWDVAAALAIAKSAGCKIFIQLSQSKHRASFVVGAPTAVNEVLSVLEKHALWII